MKELVLSLVMMVSGQADLPIENVGYIATTKNGVVAMHAVSKKTDRDYIVVNEKAFKKLDTEEQTAIVAHELAHAMVKHDHGKASKKHRANFRAACFQIADAMDLDRNYTCKAEH